MIRVNGEKKEREAKNHRRGGGKKDLICDDR